MLRSSLSALNRRGLAQSLHARNFASSVKREENGMRRPFEFQANADPYHYKTRLHDRAPPGKEHEPLYETGSTGGLRQYVFNRDHAYNSINLSTVRWLTKRCWMFQREKDTHAVVLRAASHGSTQGQGRTFSVGTDHPVLLTQWEKVKNVPEGEVHPVDQFYTEFYQLCYLISQIHKPFITVMNGRMVGSAAALAINSNTRIATDESSFHLPQTGHGFFPDAGLSHFLSRLDGGMGLFLALTGYQLRGADLMHARIGTHYQDDRYLPEYFERLESNTGYFDAAHEITEQFTDDWEHIPFSLAEHLDTLHTCFDLESIGSVKDIFKQLEAARTPWASDVAHVLQSKCPISLEVTFQALKEAQALNHEDALKSEFRLVRSFLPHPDYAEGVRAVLGAKADQRQPVWDSKLHNINKLDVRKFFGKDRDTFQLPIVDFKDPYALSYTPNEVKRHRPRPFATKATKATDTAKPTTIKASA